MSARHAARIMRQQREYEAIAIEGFEQIHLKPVGWERTSCGRLIEPGRGLSRSPFIKGAVTCIRCRQTLHYRHALVVLARQ